MHTGIWYPVGTAVDAGGDIYVLAGSNGIEVFDANANGDATPKAVISGPNTKIWHPAAIALDDSGNIFEIEQEAIIPIPAPGSSALAGASILEFAAGSNGDVAPIAVISGPTTELANATAIAVAP